MRRREERKEEKKEERKDTVGVVVRTDNPFYGQQLADLLQQVEGASPNIRNLETLRDNFLKDPEWVANNPTSAANMNRKTENFITDLIEVQHKLGAAMAAVHELNERLARYGS